MPGCAPEGLDYEESPARVPGQTGPPIAGSTPRAPGFDAKQDLCLPDGGRRREGWPSVCGRRRHLARHMLDVDLGEAFVITKGCVEAALMLCSRADGSDGVPEPGRCRGWTHPGRCPVRHGARLLGGLVSSHTRGWEPCSQPGTLCPGAVWQSLQPLLLSRWEEGGGRSCGSSGWRRGRLPRPHGAAHGGVIGLERDSAEAGRTLTPAGDVGSASSAGDEVTRNQPV